MQPMTATASDTALHRWSSSSSSPLSALAQRPLNQTAPRQPSSSLGDYRQRNGVASGGPTFTSNSSSSIATLAELFAAAPVDSVSQDVAEPTSELTPNGAAAPRSRANNKTVVGTAKLASQTQVQSQSQTQAQQQRKAANAAKRARRSEIERQSRERRMGTVAHMRGELERLERTYAQIVQQQAGESRGVIAHPREVAVLRSAYLALSAEARALRQQQKQLHAMLHERQLFHDAVRSRAWSDADDEFPWSAVAHASFTALSPAQCFEIMRESLQVIARFEVGSDAVSSGATYLGWADRRRVDTETSSMHFSFTKQFAHESAERLMEQSWATFCDEAKMRKNVFSAAVRVHLEVLQVVNEDVCVVRRQTKYVAMDRAFHTVYLLFRIETATGYKICFRTIPAPDIQNALEDHETWIDIFHWTHLTRLTDASGNAAGTELVFGGSIGAGVMKFAMHWMLELAMTVVRWENACVAPMALQPPTAAAAATTTVAD